MNYFYLILQYYYMNITKFTYSLSLIALLLFSSINFHALSHLTDNDELSAIEHCDTCDDYLVLQKHDLLIPSPSYENSIIGLNFIDVNQLYYSVDRLFSFKHQGQYFNKPPPSFI